MNLSTSASDRRHDALGKLVIAIMAVVGALYLYQYVSWPWVLDPSNPDFDLIFAFVLALLAASVWFSGSVLLELIRSRRFGTTFLELDDNMSPRLGGTSSGRVRTERQVPARGDFRIALTCLDVHEFRRIGDTAHTWKESFPVWSAETSIPAATDSSICLPFRFKLPASVGPETSPSGIVSGKGNRSRMTIHAGHEAGRSCRK